MTFYFLIKKKSLVIHFILFYYAYFIFEREGGMQREMVTED